MAFFGIEASKTPAEIQEPLSSNLHLTRACLASLEGLKKDNNNPVAFLKLIDLFGEGDGSQQGEQQEQKAITVAVLSRQSPMCELNLYVDPMTTQFVVEGDVKVG